jgi:serine O-acetyltransferase
MIEDFRIYYKPGESIKSKIGSFLHALFEPGFCAVILYRISNYLYKKKIFFLPLLIMRMNKFFTQVDISYECTIGRRLRLAHCLDIVIGSTAIIGDDVEILNCVTLGAMELRSEKKRHPTIEDHVFIGSGAKILGDITIGKGAKIGANAVVMESVPAGSTAVGIPAKAVK